MPRGVFHLFWETILSNKPIGAYVVNRAKDGSHYWVFALASPLEDGFLSVRLKPSSPIFEVIKQKYADLLAAEESRNLSPKESQGLLLDEIRKLNYRDYQHFMIEALTLEMECRQKNMKKAPISILSQLRNVAELGTQIQKECESIFSAYRENALTPLNLQVQAARIGQEAAPIAVISSQYDEIAEQIRAGIDKLLSAGSLVQQRASTSCKFDICAALLQREVISAFEQEDKETPIDKDMEMSFLRDLEEKGLLEANRSFTLLEAEFNNFKFIYEDVRKLATALEIVSVTGKIEAVKVQQSSVLMGLLERLNIFKNTLKERLKKIDSIGGDLIAQTHQRKEKVSTGKF